MRSWLALVILLGTVPARAAQPSPAYGYRAEDKTLWVTAPDGRRYQTVIPCSGTTTLVSGDRLYVACGDEGVAVYSLESASTPQLVGVRDLGGTVVGFHETAGGVWAELLRREARLLGPAITGAARLAAPALPAPPVTAPAAAVAPAPAAEPLAFTPPQMRPIGQVVELRGSRVVISVGRSSGLAVGDRVKLYELEDVALGAGQTAQETVVLAVGEVVTVADERSEVELGRNELVPIGTKAMRTDAPLSASRILPPRVVGVWELALTVRPFLALGSYGAGALSNASVGLRLEHNLHLLALFEPLGIGIARAGNIFAGSAALLGAFDTRYFEVGLGLGWTTLNGVSPVLQQNNQWQTYRSGFLLAQMARLGAEDGLHLAARNTFVEYGGQFHWGSTVGEVRVPVSDRAWVEARGGGGDAGYAFGEIGVRLLMRGNGGHDSLFMTASLGGASLERTNSDCSLGCGSSTGYGGPMVGLGVEWRP